MGRIKTDFEDLTSEAIANLREDRERTKDLLKDLVKYLSADEHRHKEVGLTAAKYLETLQRSNEQLVKVVALQQKLHKEDSSLSADEREEIFSEINKENDSG